MSAAIIFQKIGLRLGVLRRHVTEAGRSASHAREADLRRFPDQIAHRLQQPDKIKGFFQQGAHAGSQRGENLVGPRGDDDDGQDRIFRHEL